MKNILQKNKLVLWLGIIIIIIIIIIFVALSYLFVNYQKTTTMDSSKKDLQLLANEKAAQVSMFLEFQKGRAASLGSLTAFKEAALYPNNASKIEAAKNIINDLKNSVWGITILSKEGIVVVAELDPPGTDYSMVPVFPVTESSTVYFSRYYDPFRKDDYYAVGGLIRDDQNKVIGVVAFDVELAGISDIMKETQDSETNEVYLIDETGLLLSKSKYIGQDSKGGILIQEIESDGAKGCWDDLKKYGQTGQVEEHEEEMESYLNYMGNEVYGAHAYVPVIGGCVIAEESVDEISHFSSLDLFKNIFNKMGDRDAEERQ